MLWSLFNPDILSSSVKREIVHAQRVLVPAPALYEAVRAITGNRIKNTPSEAVDALPDLIEKSGFEVLHPDTNDWIEAAGYGWPHGDPFDRLIYAMACLRNLALVTADEKLLQLERGVFIDAR